MDRQPGILDSNLTPQLYIELVLAYFECRLGVEALYQNFFVLYFVLFIFFNEIESSLLLIIRACYFLQIYQLIFPYFSLI